MGFAEAPVRSNPIQVASSAARSAAGGKTAQPVLPISGDARTSWREMLATGLYQTGALRMLEGLSRSYEVLHSKGSWPRWRRVSSTKFAVLCYHRVGMEGIPLYSRLAPESFEAQMGYLRERYRIVSLEQLCCELEDPEATGQAV